VTRAKDPRREQERELARQIQIATLTLEGERLHFRARLMETRAYLLEARAARLKGDGTDTGHSIEMARMAHQMAHLHVKHLGWLKKDLLDLKSELQWWRRRRRDLEAFGRVVQGARSLPSERATADNAPDNAGDNGDNAPSRCR
jgi:hypothetical protein